MPASSSTRPCSPSPAVRRNTLARSTRRAGSSTQPTPDAIAAALAAFRAAHASWLERDARAWSAGGAEVDRYAFGQLLVHAEHDRVRSVAAHHGLALYGDLHVGYAASDAEAYADAFLRDYKMGAPPSRTNPDGQPWGYPVLDPAQYAGRARDALARATRQDVRGIRQRARRSSARPGVSVGLPRERSGSGHGGAARRAAVRFARSRPELARYAIARPEQLDRSLPRYADGWVRELDAAQVARYAVLIDALIASAVRAGRDPSDLSFEVLSTMPRPLGAVLERHRLGRWRVLQKANLADPDDVYRSENAQPADWAMLGNHDTAPIFAVIAGWSVVQRERWARHLAERLRLREPARLAGDGFLASAMLAELFASRAENVSIFFADLFGNVDRFNVPGVVDAANWSLRLPADFERVHAERLAEGRALDLPLAAQLALASRDQ